MSETLDLNVKTAHVEAPYEAGENSGTAQGGPDNQSERPKPPSINTAPTPLNKESDQPAAVPLMGQQSDERIENLMSLFHDFLEAAPNKAGSGSSHTTQQNKAGRKRFFGLPKGFSEESGSNNRYDYEQKYPRDRFGEEVSDNSRVWLTYLDEAEAFDRERAEGWKETVDVLLIFAGLFSGVITTFISQASQSLQKDNTQVSASLLSEAVQLLRANFSGVPASNVPSSTLTPISPFTASANTLLVNGLWFTSLAITLSAALFAVLAKQWLYYYLSSIPGTANEKARARQLRFNGFESWRVAVIVELLPILLHLAVGMFLTGIIILLFPLDIYIAGTIVIIAGITYILYFISVMLPIWYPACPYTTSLTIYIGILLFVLQQVLQKINKEFQAVWRKGNLKARLTIEHLAQSLVRHGFMFISKLAGAVHCGFRGLRSTIFPGKLPKFTKWREENIKKAVKDAVSLDFEALKWLYATSPNRSVQRIIARCAAVHPTISKQFEYSTRCRFLRTLEISETNVVDLRHGLCLNLSINDYNHWELLSSIPDAVEGQLEEGEYQTYLRFADTLSPSIWDHQALLNAINADFSLPLAVWVYLLEEIGTSADAKVAMHILTRGTTGLFNWELDPAREVIRNGGLVCFNSRALGWWKFEYLFHYFKLGTPDYSSDVKTYETCYLLLITIYCNLTSDDPLIIDEKERQGSMEDVFVSFFCRLRLTFNGSPRTLEDGLRFFTEICCVDLFWCESMTDKARNLAVGSLSKMNISMTTQALDNHLPFTNHDDVTLIYQWYSRDLDSELLVHTPPFFTLLLLPQNRHHLSKILLDDQAQDRVSHFSQCLYNVAKYSFMDGLETCIFSILMDLLKSVSAKKNPLFSIIYDLSVLLQLWKLFVFSNCDTKSFFLLLKSKIDRDKLDELFAAMNELAGSASDDLPDRCQWDIEFRVHICSALPASAHEFGQFIGVSHTRPEATTDRSAPENSASDKDHDTEERAQVSEHKNYHTITDWMKKAFESIWSKTPRQK